MKYLKTQSLIQCYFITKVVLFRVFIVMLLLENVSSLKKRQNGLNLISQYSVTGGPG
jgi:hypothetical protein